MQVSSPLLSSLTATASGVAGITCNVLPALSVLSARHFGAAPPVPPAKIWLSPDEVDKIDNPKDKVAVTVNGRERMVSKGKTVMEALGEIGFSVPNICYHPRLALANRRPGTCRLCQIEIDGKLQISCNKPVEAGMKIETDSADVIKPLRKFLLEAYEGCHPNTCVNCHANGNCELQNLLHRYNVGKNTSFNPPGGHGHPHLGTSALDMDFDKCINCGRCVYACNEVQRMNVLGSVGRGSHRRPGTMLDAPLDETHCIECGQCSVVCPVGAITERPDWQHVFEEIANKRKIVVCATAPAVRVAFGETMGLEPGSATQGQMVAALKRLGFEHVFDTNYSADLTIMEEGFELIARLEHWIKNKGMKPHTMDKEAPSAAEGHGHGHEGGHAEPGVLPMFTSCCPAWVTEVEKEHPELIRHLSTSKSPQQMLGAVVKHYWAKKMNLRPQDVYFVSVMPCTAKKHEAARPEMGGVNDDGPFRHIDAVITTREVGHMMRLKNIHLKDLPDEKFDDPLGDGTGAAVIFGVTGGVMEAALRTAAEVITGTPLPKVELHAVRGLGGIREATIPLLPKDSPPGTEPIPLRVAIASGIGYAKELVRKMQSGEVMYDFVEVMACPGGCIGGGGQPKTKDPAALVKRMRSIYKLDEANTLRRSHENPSVQRMYKEFMGEPNGPLAHELLHTTYVDLSKKVVP